MTTPIDKLTICVKGLKAIQARISGVWDEPALEAFGPLSVDTVKDVLSIAEQALTEAGMLFVKHWDFNVKPIGDGFIKADLL